MDRGSDCLARFYAFLRCTDPNITMEKLKQREMKHSINNLIVECFLETLMTKTIHSNIKNGRKCNISPFIGPINNLDLNQNIPQARSP